MRLAFIGCTILSREVNYCLSQTENFVHAFWLEQGLHNTPKLLTESLQEKINEIEQLDEKQKDDFRNNGQGFDAIIIGYGLCSNGVIGLHSSKLPIIIPRCDDCMALFLGSHEKYLEIFNSQQGIYWYSKPWMEAYYPSKERYEKLHKHYTEIYDEDTADFLIESETSFISEYNYLYFIKSDLYNDDKEANRAKEVAEDFNWQYNEAKSDLTFIRDLVDGKWDERFLICQPNQTVVADYTGLKIKAE